LSAGLAATASLSRSIILNPRKLEPSSNGWLACAIGNERAARFYEKSGWRRIGTMVSRLDTANGPFDLGVWRYEKRLAPVVRA
jgi:hypothetical protein